MRKIISILLSLVSISAFANPEPPHIEPFKEVSYLDVIQFERSEDIIHKGNEELFFVSGELSLGSLDENTETMNFDAKSLTTSFCEMHLFEPSDDEYKIAKNATARVISSGTDSSGTARLILRIGFNDYVLKCGRVTRTCKREYHEVCKMPHIDRLNSKIEHGLLRLTLGANSGGIE